MSTREAAVVYEEAPLLRETKGASAGQDGPRSKKARRVSGTTHTSLLANKPPLWREKHISQLLGETTVEGLEGLIFSSVVTGQSISIQQLASAAKRDKQSSAEETTTREAKKLFCGWSSLDENVLSKVFSSLCLKEKVLCASRICKDWNQMRTRQELFCDLSDQSGPNDEGMLGLLRWLPERSQAAVRGIRLQSSTSSCFFNRGHMLGVYERLHISKTNVNAALKTAPHNRGYSLTGTFKEECEGLADLEKLVLRGASINFHSLGIPFNCGAGPSLQCLVLDDLFCVKPTFEIRPDVEDQSRYKLSQVLGKCHSLKVLRVPQLLVSGLGLVKSLGVIGNRESMVTKLQVLDLTMSMKHLPAKEVRDTVQVVQLWMCLLVLLHHFSPHCCHFLHLSLSLSLSAGFVNVRKSDLV